MKVILAEKPSVARDIARVLGARARKEGYLEGNGFQVTWAFGHLVELAPPDAYDEGLKRWTMAPLPFIPDRFKLRISSRKGVRKQFNIIKALFTKSAEIICATDAGREGELIFRYIARLCNIGRKPAKRLWISSLTDSAIRRGFDELRPLAEFDNLAEAARCRSEADWIIGLNSTRAYTIKHSHGRGVLSVGRVQTPVLSMIVNRDRAIRQFQPEDYWELWTRYRDADFKHQTDRFKDVDACRKIYQTVLDQPLKITTVEEKKIVQMPPRLFDLTELQRVMNRKAGLAASKTLAIAQELYESKCISYPRTESRYLTDDLFPECGPILDRLRRLKPEAVAALDLDHLRKHANYFNAAKVSDHHAIIPTGEISGRMTPGQQRVFDEIVTRFIAIFHPACEKGRTTVGAESAGEKFTARGTRIVAAGWLALYEREEKDKKKKQKSDDDEDEAENQALPSFVINESGPHAPQVRQRRTKPPKHFTEAALLSAMETAGKEIDDDALQEAMKQKGLGTPATRAGIIETLVKRDYIRKQKRILSATAKGEDLVRLLSPQQILTSPALTGEWEHKLKLMEEGRIQAQQFMAEVNRFARGIIATVNSGQANAALGLGPCPICGSPVIKGKTGFGCSAWRDGCRFRFQAEQFGTLLKEKDIPALLTTGRLRRPRKLKDPEGEEVSGYITLDAKGNIGILRRETENRAKAVSLCPLCGSRVIKGKTGFGCAAWRTGCPFRVQPEHV